CLGALAHERPPSRVYHKSKSLRPEMPTDTLHLICTVRVCTYSGTPEVTVGAPPPRVIGRPSAPAPSDSTASAQLPARSAARNRTSNWSPGSIFHGATPLTPGVARSLDRHSDLPGMRYSSRNLLRSRCSSRTSHSTETKPGRVSATCCKPITGGR